MGVPEKVQKLKNVLEQDSVQKQFQNALDEKSGALVASIIDLYNNDNYLQQCSPAAVVQEALKAATLKLPINKQLGFAYIIPYNDEPEFQIGYKGYIQLAMRTGQYKHLNAGIVYEGEAIEHDKLKGNYYISGERESDTVKGYFAHMELTNGFTKTEYMTKEEVKAHAKKYSKSYGNNKSAWSTDFDKMAKKTVVRKLLSTWGIMSTEMVSAFSKENNYSTEEEVEIEKEQEANQETIDVDPENAGGPDKEDEDEEEENEMVPPGQREDKPF